MVKGSLKFGVFLPFYPLDAMIKTASFAEKNGFDSIWACDHMVGRGGGGEGREFLDAWSILSALAIQTKKTQLGVGVTDPHRRHVAILAITATTIDHLSNGRLIIGFGAGEAMNLTPYGFEHSKPISKIRETLILLKKFWSQDAVDYQGEFYKLERAIIKPETIHKPHPPLWMAANSTRALNVTAELADGWIPLLLLPQEYKDNLRLIQEKERYFNRNSGAVTPAIALWTVSRNNRDKAIEIMSNGVKPFFPQFRSDYLKQKGYDEIAREDFKVLKMTFPPGERTKEFFETCNKIPFDIIQDFVAAGTPEECIETIEGFINAGCKHFGLVSLDPTSETLEYYAKTIVPYFKEKRT